MICSCKHKVTLDDRGSHLRACPLGLAEHIDLHNECVGLVASLARDCSFYAIVEPRKVFQTSRERPDILIKQYFPNSQRPAAIDLTFHSATAPSNVSTAMGGTGFLSRLRERHKTGKYKWQTDLINYSFIGAGMEDGGAMGPGFKDMVNHFCRRGGDPSAEGPELVHSHCESTLLSTAELSGTEGVRQSGWYSSSQATGRSS